MATTARPYPPEFRDDVVAVARRGHAPLVQIAKDLGISDGTLSNWVKRAEIEDGIKPGTKQSETDEVRAQRRRIKTLEQENEILRRAAAYFAVRLSPKSDTRWSVTSPKTRSR